MKTKYIVYALGLALLSTSCNDFLGRSEGTINSLDVLLHSGRIGYGYLCFI